MNTNKPKYDHSKANKLSNTKDKVLRKLRVIKLPSTNQLEHKGPCRPGLADIEKHGWDPQGKPWEI